MATGRLFLNFRFAQPNRMLHIAHGFQYFPDISFPFAYGDSKDPFSDKTEGILTRCTARNTCPKILHTNTGTEYWQSGQSLVTTDPAGKTDAPVPAKCTHLPFRLNAARRAGDTAKGGLRHAPQHA